MSNKHGLYGCVNETGIPGGNAEMFKAEYSDSFFEQIEAGILDVVKVCLKVGLMPFSSCQGHPENSLFCNVSIIDEKGKIIQLKERLEHDMKQNNCHLVLDCFPYEQKTDIYSDYKEPYILKIIFGKYNDPQLEERKKLFCSRIEEVVHG